MLKKENGLVVKITPSRDKDGKELPFFERNGGLGFSDSMYQRNLEKEEQKQEKIIQITNSTEDKNSF